MLNMNFSHSLAIPYDSSRWQSSPASGVWRYPLEREQAESGHVTSLVRFEANSYFPEHTHPLGEEFWVLEGTFSDESGDYPAGTYVRNPPGSQHRSFTKAGCVIFVKLNQFALDDTKWLTVLPEQALWLTAKQGYRRLPLHQHLGVHTSVLHFPEGGRFPACCYKGGLEVLVLTGALRQAEQHYAPLSWLRFAANSQPSLTLAPNTQLWVRTGHLAVD